MSHEVLVDIKDLTVEYVWGGGFFGRSRRRIRVLDRFNLQVFRGETLGIVGESGCGKSTLANSLLRFVRPTGGQVLFEGQDLLTMDRARLRQQRRQMQIVFQNPFSSLNPRMTILDIVGEPLVTHTGLRRQALRERVTALLEEVGLGSHLLDRHPHELSGGQAQRVALARALALNPKLLVLDEPTSALDVSVQAQIVNLLAELQKRHGLTYLFISHSLGVVQHISTRIAVLYMGEIVELGSREGISTVPKHPYTLALFSSTPTVDPDRHRQRIILEGQVPSLANPPQGCRFHTRCPYVMDRCRSEKPTVHWIENEHWAMCHLLDSNEREGGMPMTRM
jgi:oligopeptide/dipeptide ABC transporter ATP-binding protein